MYTSQLVIISPTQAIDVLNDSSPPSLCWQRSLMHLTNSIMLGELQSLFSTLSFRILVPTIVLVLSLIDMYWMYRHCAIVVPVISILCCIDTRSILDQYVLPIPGGLDWFSKPCLAHPSSSLLAWLFLLYLTTVILNLCLHKNERRGVHKFCCLC